MNYRVVRSMQWWRAALAALSLAAAAGIAGGVGGAGGAEGSAPLERPSPEAIAKVQQTLLAMMGLKRRPRLLTKGKPRVFVPAAMLALYEQLSHPDSDHPLPPPFTQQTPLQHRVANTVRSFTHQGMFICKLYVYYMRLALIQIQINNHRRSMNYIIAVEYIFFTTFSSYIT